MLSCTFVYFGLPTDLADITFRGFYTLWRRNYVAFIYFRISIGAIYVKEEEEKRIYHTVHCYNIGKKSYD